MSQRAKFAFPNKQIKDLVDVYGGIRHIPEEVFVNVLPVLKTVCTKIYDLRQDYPKAYKVPGSSSVYTWNTMGQPDKITMHSCIPILESITQAIDAYSYPLTGADTILPRIPYHFWISKKGNIFWLNNLTDKVWQSKEHNHGYIGIIVEGTYSSSSVALNINKSTNAITYFNNTLQMSSVKSSIYDKTFEIPQTPDLNPSLFQLTSVLKLLYALSNDTTIFGKKITMSPSNLFTISDLEDTQATLGSFMNTIINAVRSGNLSINSNISYVERDIILSNIEEEPITIYPHTFADNPISRFMSVADDVSYAAENDTKVMQEYAES